MQNARLTAVTSTTERPSGGMMIANTRRWLVTMTLITAVLIHGGPLMAQGQQNFIVTFQPGTLSITRAVAVRNAGATARVDLGIVNGVAISGSPASIAALRSDPAVVSITPDRQVFAHQRVTARPENPGGGKKDQPGDDGSATSSPQPTPPGVDRVVPDGALELTGQGVGVAIMDTGIDLTHPDLSANVQTQMFSAHGVSAQDDNGHGTHVAGTVAAVDNTIDVVGVAPGAHLYAVKVLNSAGSGLDSDLIAGLTFALDHNDLIQVINMSLGRPLFAGDIGGPLHQAIQAVVNAGTTIIVSAGNDYLSEVSQQVPAAFPEVISVASTTAVDGTNRCRSYNGVIAADTASYFTTDGPGVTVSAPGEEREDISRGCRVTSIGVLSTELGGGTTRKSGTSMAAPHVAGIVARMVEWCADQQPTTCTPASIKAWLTDPASIDGENSLPIPSPVPGRTDDGTMEGIAQAPRAAWAPPE